MFLAEDLAPSGERLVYSKMEKMKVGDRNENLFESSVMAGSDISFDLFSESGTFLKIVEFGVSCEGEVGRGQKKRCLLHLSDPD